MEKSPRLLYLDWMRGFAVLVMLQGHSFHSWYRDDLRANSDLFQLSQLAGGFPGALFLFMTGISLVILFRRAEQPGQAQGSPWKVILRRGGHILLLAILFRLQMWAFYWGRSSWKDLLRVDILNTIAVAIVLAGVVMMLASERRRILAAAGGAVAIGMLTPLVWQIPPRILPFNLMSYFSGYAEGAAFPIFPWVSYTFTGVVVGLVVVGKRDAAEVDRVMQWLVLLALVLAVAARFFDYQPYTYYHPYDFWNTSPNLVANKTAVVLLLFVGCYAWSKFTDPARFSWVRQIGRTSLLIYWVHVELVYGRFLTFPQHSLDSRQTVLAVLALTASMLALSLVKTWLVERRRSVVPPAASGAKSLANSPPGD